MKKVLHIDKKVICIIVIIILCLLILIFGILKKDDASNKFNDTIILGHKSSDIVKEYGNFYKVWNISETTEEFDSKWQGLYFYFSEEDLSGNNVNYYYIIYFDENDIAIYTKMKALPLSK